jgi:methyl-accepting chemotaxis protein
LAAERIQKLIAEFRHDTKTMTKQMESFIRFVKSAMKSKTEDDGFQYNLSESALVQIKLLSNSYLHDKLRDTEQLQERRARIKNELEDLYCKG